MRKLIPLLLLILLALVAAPFLIPERTPSPQALRNLPWQVEALPDGTSRVFGLHLGEASMQDARDRLGDDMELAIVAGEDRDGLEMFYSRFTAGVLSGTLIVAADIAPDTLAQLRERAVAADYMDSGARKFRLSPDDLPLAWDAPVKGLTFVPAVNIDTDTARKRFGEPGEVATPNEGAEHWLYPDKGLDLILNESGREVLQYVAPRDFATLSEPLQ